MKANKIKTTAKVMFKAGFDNFTPHTFHDTPWNQLLSLNERNPKVSD